MLLYNILKIYSFLTNKLSSGKLVSSNNFASFQRRFFQAQFNLIGTELNQLIIQNFPYHALVKHCTKPKRVLDKCRS